LPRIGEKENASKKVGRFWLVRIGLHDRALAIEFEAQLAWFWIGTHAEYDRLLR